VNLCITYNDFSEQDITNRTENIIDQIINFLTNNILIKQD